MRVVVLPLRALIIYWGNRHGCPLSLVRGQKRVCVKMTRGRWPHWHWKCRKAGIVEEIEQTRGPCKILSPGSVLCPRNRSRLWPKKSKTVMKMSLAKLAQWYCFSFFLTCFCRSLRYFVWFWRVRKTLTLFFWGAIISLPSDPCFHLRVLTCTRCAPSCLVCAVLGWNLGPGACQPGTLPAKLHAQH